MSKQSDAKAQQGYRPAAARQCANCVHYASETETIKRGTWDRVGWVKESQIRCMLGGFKVTRSAICNSWTLRESANL